MRIAQVAPLYESVPPKLYGGTERVVSYLTEELVAQGHDVTLFASGDSETSAQLIPVCPAALRLDKGCVDQLAHHFVMLQEVMDRAEQFDIIHFHVDYLHFPLSRLAAFPHVTTLHGRLDLPDLLPVYRKFRDMPVISISHNQRKPLPMANWVGNAYHGLPQNSLNMGNGSGKYLAFLGRISPEKRADRAIEIAVRLGMPLKIAAKIDRADRDYFESTIKPLLCHRNVEYIGEITQKEKSAFLGNALAYLFPIDWPEPFGLTMIEAMACGTPTVAFGCGSVPEVLTPDVSGLIVNSMDEAVLAVEKAATMSRATCRREFDRRFTAHRMAADYVKLYEAAVSTSSFSAPSVEVDSCLTL
ncbi:MAG TPA: glycosyltransferase family 4 protein [Candidatus Acidoferrum sp.]|jgi:glycosyltransferase involved in cell wall biosynthesis